MCSSTVFETCRPTCLKLISSWSTWGIYFLSIVLCIRQKIQGRRFHFRGLFCTPYRYLFDFSPRAQHSGIQNDQNFTNLVKNHIIWGNNGQFLNKVPQMPPGTKNILATTLDASVTTRTHCSHQCVKSNVDKFSFKKNNSPWISSFNQVETKKKQRIYNGARATGSADD